MWDFFYFILFLFFYFVIGHNFFFQAARPELKSTRTNNRFFFVLRLYSLLDSGDYRRNFVCIQSNVKKKNLPGEGSLGAIIAQLRHCYSAHYGYGYYVTNIFQKAQKIHSRVIQSLLPVIIRFDTSRHSSLKTLRAHCNWRRRPAAAKPIFLRFFQIVKRKKYLLNMYWFVL